MPKSKIRGTARGRFSVAAGFLTTALVLTGCGSASEAAADNPFSGKPGWDALIEAGKKDGELVIYGRPDPGLRAVADEFQELFGIKTTTTLGREELQTRIEKERAKGIYGVDVMVDGGSGVYKFYKQDFLAPVAPMLLDEVKDPKLWNCAGCDLAGSLPFIDPENSHVLRLVNAKVPIGMYNTKLVKPEQLQTFEDLVAPEFAGNIGLKDPHSGSGAFNVDFLRAMVGDEFVTKLYTQNKATVLADSRQLEEEVLRGTSSLIVAPTGTTPVDVEPLKKQGQPVEYIWELKGANYDGAVFSTGLLIEYFKDAPNPGAAALFFNWLMTKEGAQSFAQNLNFPSTRADLDNSWVAAKESIPEDGKKYLDAASWTSTEKLMGDGYFQELITLTGAEG